MSKKSSSASSTLSPPPFSAISSPVPIAPAPARSKYSMEEVWKNICLSTSTASLHHPPTPSNITAGTSSRSSSAHGSLSQEFLTSSRPLSRPSSFRDRVYPQYSTSSHNQHHHRHSCFEVAQRNILGLQSYSQLGQDDPAAANILRLNSSRPEEYPPSLKAPMMPSNNFHPHQDEADVLNSSVANFEFPILPEKRAADDKSRSPSGGKNKRMIKNRESAARSRARKQAYTNELEDKVARLMEENARLRRQQEKLCLAANAQFPKKPMLSRTSTAPF